MKYKSLRRAALACAAITALAFTGTAAQAQVQPDTHDTMSKRVAACAACHGAEGRATRDGYFPRIAGKPAQYLYNQLINFREGRRDYPLMTYLVAHLSDDYLNEMAHYFADLDLPYAAPPVSRVPTAVLEQGRTLIMNGDPARNLPACIACHGERLTGALPSMPSLVGLSQDYVASQMGAWKNGTRRAASPDCMADISKRLAPEDIAAITAWLSSQPVPTDMSPAPNHLIKMPVACGSFPQ